MKDLSIALLLVAFCLSVHAKDKHNFTDNPKTYKLSCLRLEHRIKVIKSKLKRGYSLTGGARLKQQLEYYHSLKNYYKCK